ncbi:mRNA cleavage and polyadenylation factor subunit [Friedmanniomyces endolithicus]|nr:mRNA cleavage and polyadenylation factor subunit [Friedmanniomyces endolithicus]
MQCYTELLPPTAVTHALALPFLTPAANNLVVAKSSLLQIFDIISAPNTTTARLSLIAEYPLSGTPTALRSLALPTTPTGGHALLLAFKDARLSLVEWDPANHRISTISIHYYEGENIALPPFGPSLKTCDSVLTVDPSSRCAALKFGARHLAILPFRGWGDELVEDADAEGEAEVGDMDTGEPAASKRTATLDNGTDHRTLTPYISSFVLPMTTLDPALTHPVHLAFLHEYREPTFGILSASLQPSLSLLEERKDCLTYSVFTLDLSQRASTNLISVPKLPSDLWRVIPLALPVGGALLVGTNELVHVDQNGKTSAVGVNEFARKASGFSMTDQSSLNMRLEDCEIEVLDPQTGDLVIVLRDGTLAVLSFKLLGRNVGGLTITHVSAEQGGQVNASAPSCVTAMQGQHLFIGREDGNSSLLHWQKDTLAPLSKKRSHAQMLDQPPAAVAEDDEEAAEDVDEDDLYAPTAESVKRVASVSKLAAVEAGSTYRFDLRDELRSLGPINDFCLGKSPKAGAEKLELMAGVGRGNASRLAFLHREIIPEEIRTRDLSNVRDAWSVSIQPKDPSESSDDASAKPNEQLFFVYDGDTTRPYKRANDSMVEMTDTSFESDGPPPLTISTLANDTIIVRARRTEITTYDTDLGLNQIIPMSDDEGDTELNVVATSFCDPYLLVLRDDSSIVILKVDRQGDLEPLDLQGTAVGEGRWLSGCLYAAASHESHSHGLGHEPAAWLLNGEGGLHCFALPDLREVYAAPTLPFLPPVLSADAPQRRGGKVALTELLVTDLGTEELHRPYMIVRSSLDDLTLYEPFHHDATTTSASLAGKDNGFEGLRFRKVPTSYVPKYDEGLDNSDGSDAGRPAPLRAVRVTGRSMMLVPGQAPSLLIKEAVGQPKFLGLRTGGKVNAFVPLQTTAQVTAESGNPHFALVDAHGKLKEFRLPVDGNTGYETGWSVHTVPLALPTDDGERALEVRHVAFHEARNVYVVAACSEVDFVLPEEDDEGGGRTDQDDITLRPQIPQYSVHLLSATTHRIIESVSMPYGETVTSMKVLPLEASERTHEQRSMIVIGTATIRGEDLPAKGALTVLDIIDVVPDPDRPESGIKMKAVAREDTKGAITALEAFGDCGLVGTAQGQKIMIRGLKEDGSCLPVAFLDAQTYITTLRAFGRSGLWLAGDAWKGLWFGGFIEEPYKLNVLGKSRTQMEVMAAEFLPFDGQLFVVVVDAEMGLHCLQYDPEDAKTLSGQRLLHRGTFHLGHFPTPAGGMMVLPSTLAPMSEQTAVTNGNGLANGHQNGEKTAAAREDPPKLFQILTTFHSGAIGLLTPLDETTYRRLSGLQAQLTSLLEHAAGLNPRAFRAAVGSEGRGGVVDGSLVQRIGELGAARRAEVLGRAGGDGWSLRSDLEVLGGGGLGYL